MAVLEEIEVHVVSSRSKEDLVEYDEPDAEAAAEDREVQKFVEAVSDEEFYVRVTLKAGFNYHGAHGVDVTLTIDGDAISRSWYQPLNAKSICHRKAINDISYEFRTASVRRSHGWARVAFVFGKAELGRRSTVLKVTCLIVLCR